MKIIKIILKLIKISNAERRALFDDYYKLALKKIFLFQPYFLNYQVSYPPDSQVGFGAHPEFAGLFKSFIKYNKLNNAGDIPRLWCLILNIKHILEQEIEGDFAELGVWRGNTASVLAYFAARNSRDLFLFDTFEGFNSNDIKGIDSDKEANSFNNTSIEMVKEVIGENTNCCHFVKGYFPTSLQDSHKTKKFSVVSLDCDLYEPMKASLAFFYPLMSRGGILLLHDYSSHYWPGSKLAVDEFCKESGEFIVLMPDKSGSAFLRKTK